MSEEKQPTQSMESHWRTVAVTIILALLSWQATKVVNGQDELIAKLNQITVAMAELKVRLDGVAKLSTEVNKIEHRVTILEQRMLRHEEGKK